MHTYMYGHVGQRKNFNIHSQSSCAANLATVRLKIRKPEVSDDNQQFDRRQHFPDSARNVRY